MGAIGTMGTKRHIRMHPMPPDRLTKCNVSASEAPVSDAPGAPCAFDERVTEPSAAYAASDGVARRAGRREQAAF